MAMLYRFNTHYIEAIQANRNRIYVSIVHFQDCFDQSDELDCDETTHFYCNDTGAVSFIERSKVCLAPTVDTVSLIL